MVSRPFRIQSYLFLISEILMISAWVGLVPSTNLHADIVDEGSGPITLEISQGEFPGELLITWNTLSGNRYILEKTGQLGEWFEVVSLVADDTSMTVTESQLFGDQKTFWRVNAVGENGEPLEVSEVMVTYSLSSAQSDILFHVVASGTETVQDVLFYDGGLLLGNASQGPGNVWSFSLLLDDTYPTPQHLTAEATTDQGTIEATGTYSFLLADPSKFVPLDPSGIPQYGEFISVTIDGQLGPFQFIPEGGSSDNRNCGVRFVFPNGGALVGTGADTRISFLEGSFVRGDGDPNPVSYAGTDKQLPVVNLTKADVSSAFSLPLDDPIPLRWGRSWVDWYSGILGEGGWRELYVTPRMGDFSFPGSQEPTTPTVDPDTGEELLLMSFHGEWRPFEGPVLFRIPLAEPLNIYQSRARKISVQGTVEADLPSGVTVKGSVTWREPNFEVRLEGRNITIGALNSIRSVLPEDPESQIPSGDTNSELDTLTDTLLGYRNTLRSISVGGLTNAEPAEGDTYKPSAGPVDPAGTALEAWAWRAETWASDRAGQYLGVFEIEELVGVIQLAGTTGVAAQDLTTVLKLIHDLLLVKKNLLVMLGPAETTKVEEDLDNSLSQLYATADRMIEDTPEFSTSDEFKEASDLLDRIKELWQEEFVEPLDTGSGAYRRLEAVIPLNDGGVVLPLKTEIHRLYPRNTLVGRIWLQGELTEEENIELATMSREGLLSYLEKVAEVYVHINEGESGIPQFPFDAAIHAAEDRLIQLHNQFAVQALAGRKFEDLRLLLAERIAILDVFHLLNRQLVGDLTAFSTQTADILFVYEPLWVKWLNTIDPSVRTERFLETAKILFRIAHHSNDTALDSYLKLAWGDLRSLNDQFIESSQIIGGCDSLYVTLTEKGYRFPYYGDDYDPDDTFVMTGRYESNDFYSLNVNQAGRYLTGWWARHTKNHKIDFYRIKGLLIEDSPSSMTFAYLRINPATDKVEEHGTIQGFKTSGEVEILKYGELSGYERYNQTSNQPNLSDSIIELFGTGENLVGTDELKSILKWNLRAPFLKVNTLHVLDRAIRTKRLIDLFNGSSSDPIFQNQVVMGMNTLVREILQQVPEDHRVLARTIFLQELSKSLYTSGSVSRTYRHGFMEIYSLKQGLMLDVPDLLGEADTVAGSLYQYTVDVVQDGVSAVFLGAYQVKVTITKSSSTNPADNFTAKYRGALGQVGTGRGATLGTTYNSMSFSSPYNYQKEEFAGAIVSGQAGANIAYGSVGTSFTLYGFFQIIGNGNKPPITINSVFNFDQATTLQLSAGLDVSAGLMALVESFDEDPDLSIATNLIQYNANKDAEFGSVLHFDFDSAEISSCGRTALREFLAEYLIILRNPDAIIQVVGYTDTVGAPLYNEQLSQSRADNVKAAMLSILGNPPGLSERIDSEGLGEAPMLNETGNDETRDMNWRRVEITLNGIVKVKISAAGVKLADTGGSEP